MLMLGAPDVTGEMIALFAMTGSFVLVIAGATLAAIRSIARTRAREQTRREIAAYVAEGSITPDDAAKLLEAGEPAPGCLGRRG